MPVEVIYFTVGMSVINDFICHGEQTHVMWYIFLLLVGI